MLETRLHWGLPRRPVCRQDMGSPDLARVILGKASKGLAPGPLLRLDCSTETGTWNLSIISVTKICQLLRWKMYVFLPRIYLSEEHLEIAWAPCDSAMWCILLSCFLPWKGIKSCTVNTDAGLVYQPSLAPWTPDFDSSLLLSLISFSSLVIYIACMELFYEWTWSNDMHGEL